MLCQVKRVVHILFEDDTKRLLILVHLLQDHREHEKQAEVAHHEEY